MIEHPQHARIIRTRVLLIPDARPKDVVGLKPIGSIAMNFFDRGIMPTLSALAVLMPEAGPFIARA